MTKMKHNRAPRLMADSFGGWYRDLCEEVPRAGTLLDEYPSAESQVELCWRMHQLGLDLDAEERRCQEIEAWWSHIGPHEYLHDEYCFEDDLDPRTGM